MLAGWLCDVLVALENGHSEKVAHHVREEVVQLCRCHPVYRCQGLLPPFNTPSVSNS